MSSSRSIYRRARDSSRRLSSGLEILHRPLPSSARRRHYSHDEQAPFRVAVIGSGPAGFYTAYKIMSNIKSAAVDMYELLPVPYGLVRYGVAPDHPEVKVRCLPVPIIPSTETVLIARFKKCEDKFAEVASSPRFNFIGNVGIGRDLPLSHLKNYYNAFLFAYGASKDRSLGLPGESTLKGVYSARAFVGWYNGLPDYADLSPDLEAGEEAVIIGQGNVALDVARILLTDIERLRNTDITCRALDGLAKSRVKRVRIVGRRGPMQVCNWRIWGEAYANLLTFVRLPSPSRRYVNS